MVRLFQPVLVFGEWEEAWVVGVVAGGQEFSLFADVKGAGGHFIPVDICIEFSGALGFAFSIIPHDLNFAECLGFVEHGNGGCRWESDVGCVIHLCFNAIGIAEVAGEEGAVHGVASHVSDGARAVFAVSAPCEGVKFWGVRNFGALGEPGLPVEVGGDGFGDEGVFGFLALGPDGAVGPDVDFFHATDDAHGEVLFEEADAFDEVALVPHVGDDAFCFGGLVELVGLPHAIDEGFLNADMFAAPDGLHGCGEVGVVWGGDGDAVEFVAHGSEHFAEVFEDACVGVEGFGFFEALAIHVAEGDDFCTGGRVRDVAGAFSAYADASELEFFGGLRAHVREEQGAGADGDGFEEGTTLEGRCHSGW